VTAVPSLGSKLIAEFVGTFFLIAAGLGVAINGGDLLAVAFAHGLAIAIGVTAVGHISGGHLNPAVTAAMVTFRQMGPIEGLSYIVAQLAGGFAAALVMMWSFGLDGAKFVATVPALGDGISGMNGVALEAVATFLLVWTVFAVAVDRDGAYFKIAGMPIGFAVTIGILMVGGATGAALNPARWFGPALMTTTFDDALVWIVGPVLGALLAGGLYLYGIKPRLAGPAADPDSI